MISDMIGIVSFLTVSPWVTASIAYSAWHVIEVDGPWTRKRAAKVLLSPGIVAVYGPSVSRGNRHG